jgi:hypothetical protein
MGTLRRKELPVEREPFMIRPFGYMDFPQRLANMPQRRGPFGAGRNGITESHRWP